MDGEEGGGKLKHTVRKHGNKPYERPKSIFQRGLDAIKSFVHQTIAPSFLQPPTSPTPEDGLNDDFADIDEADNVVNGQSSGLPLTSAAERQLNSTLTFATPLSPLAESGEHLRSLSFSRSTASNEYNKTWRRTNHLSSNGSGRFSNIGLEIDSANSCTQPSKDGLPDDHSECSDNSVSTSGCSSLVPHPDKRDYQKEFLAMSDASLKNLASKLSSSMPTARPPLHANSASTSRKQLSMPNMTKASLERSLELEPPKYNSPSTWSEENNHTHSLPQPRAAGTKPSFNVSAFGSPVWNEKSLLNESRGSPFYSGKTTYGGASAIKRPIVHVSSPYMTPSLAKRQKVCVKTVQTDVNNVEIMSSTARRILDSLEKMSTPVQDAKKIPTNSSYLNSPLSFLPSSSSRRWNLSASKPNTPVSRGPPVSKVLTPAFASVATNLQNQLPKDTNKGSKRVRDSEVEQVHSLPNTSTSDVRSRVGGKMPLARKEARHYVSKARHEDLENVEPVSLPNIPLPISSLPKFQFAATSTCASTESSKLCGEYKFSVPSLEERIPCTSDGDQSKVEAFVFQRPNDSASPSTTNFTPAFTTPSSSPLTSFNFSHTAQAPKLIKKACTEEAQSSPSGFAAAAELKIGSVMDILGKSTESKKDLLPSASSDLFSLEKFKPASGTWECAVCMIRNKAEVIKCVACESAKPGSKDDSIDSSTVAKSKTGGFSFNVSKEKSSNSETPTSITSHSSFGDKFKPSPDTWECDMCMVRNKNNVKKCIACNTPRTTSMPPPSTIFTCTDSPAFKMPASSPAVTTESTSATPGFKFGVAPASTSLCANNIKFSFGSSNTSTPAIPTSMEKTESTVAAATSADQTSTANEGFKFGTSEPTTAIGGGFKFSSVASKTREANAISTAENSFSTAAVSVFSSAATDKNSLQDVKPSNKIVPDEPSQADQVSNSSMQKKPMFSASVGSDGIKFPSFNLPASLSTAKSEEPKKALQDEANGGFKFPNTDSTSWSAGKIATTTDATTSGGFSFNPKPAGPASTSLTGSTGFVFPKPEGTNAGSSSGGFAFTFNASQPTSEKKQNEITSSSGESAIGGFAFNKPSAGVRSSNLAPTQTIFSATSSCSLASSPTTTSTSNGLPFTFGSSLPVNTTPVFGSPSDSPRPICSSKEQSAFLPSSTSVFSSPAPGNVIQSSTTTGNIFGTTSASNSAASGSIFGNLPATTTASGVFGTPVLTTTAGNLFASTTAITTTASSTNFFTTPASVATTTVSSIPTFGSFQIPATTSTVAPTFGSSTPFTFGGMTNTPAFTGLGPTVNSTSFKAVTTTASGQTSFNTASVFTTTTPSPFNAGGITTVTTAGNLFSFNNPATGTSNIFGSAAFGTTATTAVASPFSSVPAFGTSNQSSGFGGSFTTPASRPVNSNPATATFNFGSPAPTAGGFNSGTPAPTAGGFNSAFQFGSNQPQQASGLFTFTANQINAQPDPAPVMTFGTQNPVAAAPAAPAPTFPPLSMTPAPTFPPLSMTPGFNFASNSNIPPNPFQPNAGPQNPPQTSSARPFRRAVRRYRK